MQTEKGALETLVLDVNYFTLHHEGVEHFFTVRGRAFLTVRDAPASDDEAAQLVCASLAAPFVLPNLASLPRGQSVEFEGRISEIGPGTLRRIKALDMARDYALVLERERGETVLQGGRVVKHGMQLHLVFVCIDALWRGIPIDHVWYVTLPSWCAPW